MTDEEKVVRVVDAMMRDLEERNVNRNNSNYWARRPTVIIEHPTRKRRNMNFKSRGDRMDFAICTAAILAIAVPVVIGLLLLIATALLYSFGGGGHWIRHNIWGWLSDFNFYKDKGKTHEAMTPKRFPLTYFTSVVIVYVVYLFAEGCVWLGAEYAELARGRKIS